MARRPGCIPARSPFTSAMNTGTPIPERRSAITCRVTVLPVPVAPVMSPWRLASAGRSESSPSAFRAMGSGLGMAGLSGSKSAPILPSACPSSSGVAARRTFGTDALLAVRSPAGRFGARAFKFASFSAIFTGGFEKKWAGHSPFFFGATVFADVTMRLAELLERTLPPLGYELVDWEGAPGGRLVRVFIDKPEGVTVDDCARVSNHLTRLFAVENVDFERLEVSSPGSRPAAQEGGRFRPLRGRGGRASSSPTRSRTRRS